MNVGGKKRNNYRLGKYIAIYSNCVSTQLQQEKNVSCFPGCTVIGVPEQACASLTERGLQAEDSTDAGSKMLFYSVSGLITHCNIPNGRFVQFFLFSPLPPFYLICCETDVEILFALAVLQTNF